MKFVVLGVILFLLAAFTHQTICQACIKATVLAQNILLAIAPEMPARQVVQAVCEKQYDSKQLCQKVAKQLTPLALTMGVRAVVKTGRICQYFCPQGFYTRLDVDKQIKALIAGQEGESLSNLRELPILTSTLKIDNGKTKLMHMTDIHLDLNYTTNASIICDYPICCHAQHGFPETQSSKAPQFGSPKCDAPLKLYQSALWYIENNVPKVDAAVITGDYSAHNQWQKTPESVIEMRRLVEKKMKDALGITLISAPGNNEYLPDHQVDPTSVPEQSLKVIEITNQAGKVLTFIIINTLFCDNINLYLIQDQTMPLRQIKTLNNILQTKESVYLLGHIEPTSKSCSETYGILFRAVLARHSNKIKGQFYGHTHQDQFVVNTDPRDNQTATSFGLLAGSLTPLGTSLPRFRVYQLNNDFEIVNYDDYSFNLKTTKWGKNYNFKQYYGLPLDQPVDAEMMSHLHKRILSDEDLQKKYNSKIALTPWKSHHGCDIFDTRKKADLCNDESINFRQKIDDLLALVQGPWGSYGNDIE